MRSLYSLLNGLLAWLVLAPLASQAGPLPTRRLPATGQVAGSFYHSLLVRPDGSLYAWGGNGYGTLGNGTTTDSRTPVPVSQGLAPAGTRYVQVATGNTHSLALAADGTVYAWGRNKYGQLAGIHTFNYTPEPILPGAAPAGTRYVQVAAGGDYSLGLTAEGTLYGWGHNIYGELGTGTIDAASAPVAVSQGAIPAGTRFVQIAAGTQHSLALAADGTLYAWGYNTSGQLGNGTISASSLTPVAVSQGTTRFVQVAAGAAHTLAIAADGTLYAWGYNNMGQLGTGSTTDSKVPVAVSLGAAPAGTRFVQVSAGTYHSLAQAADGTLYAWGNNKDSQLGTGTTTNSLTPVAVSQGTTRFGQVVAGSASSLALAADGSVYVWGQNLYGQLGTGTTINSPTPVALAIPRAPGYVQAAAGGAHSLALLDNGSLYAWGTNSEGELGNNSTTQSLAAVAVSQGAIPVGTRFKQVSGGSFNSLALAADGTAYAWGFNNYGQLGNGTTTQSTVPVAVSQGAAPAGTRYVQLSAGLNFGYGLAADGTLYAWGYNTYGQLGTGTTTHSPAPVAVSQGAAPAGTRYVQVSGGGGHALALAADGTLYAWGYNNGGQLGNNSTTQRNAPVAVSQGAAPAGTRYVQVATGNNHSLALAADGTLWAWGSNSSGQLGTGVGSSGSATPVAVSQGAIPAGTRFVQIAAGSASSLALAANGTIYAWGNNVYGQLGTNSFGNAFAPLAEASGLTQWQGLASGSGAYHSLVLGAGAAVFTTGQNTSGQLGDGTTNNSSVFIRAQVPVPLPVRAATLAGATGLALYPNPAQLGTALTGAAPGAAVQVFDGLGRLLLTVPADAAGAASLGLPIGLAPGVYVVRTGARTLRLVMK